MLQKNKSNKNYVCFDCDRSRQVIRPYHKFKGSILWMNAIKKFPYGGTDALAKIMYAFKKHYLKHKITIKFTKYKF